MAFSGGMDSTGLLMHLIANDYAVHTLSYDYGQKHKIELDRAKANIQYLADNNIQVSHKIVDLQSAMSVFHSALTTEDYEIPEGHYEEEQMKQTVVPNRNAIFASILYGYALSIALKEDQEVKIALQLDFDTVFSNTNTSYNPDEQGRSSGTSGADVERILAFHAIGKVDPVTYVKPWPEVLEDAINTENKHKEKI